MRILWGALRAVSVETMGVLAVLWMLQGATGLAIDAPWRTTKSIEPAGPPPDSSHTLLARGLPTAAVAQRDAAPGEPAPEKTQRATLRQWFNTLFPAGVDDGGRIGWADEPTEFEQRAEFTRERLDHYSRLYGIASRD